MKIVYISNFNETSGFSQAARGYRDCLKGEIETFNLIIEGNNFYNVKNTIETIPNEDYCVLWHSNPNVIINAINGVFNNDNGKKIKELFANSKMNINITAWETDTINDEFLKVYEMLNTSGVIVPTEYNLNCFSKYIDTVAIQHYIEKGSARPYLKETLLKKKYILSISQWNHRKNFKDLIYCFMREFRNDSINLVLKTYLSHKDTGSKLIQEEIKKIKKNIEEIFGPIKCGVLVITNYLHEDEKNYLLDNCIAYAATPLSEGFGLGMAEAALRGKPVVAPNRGGQIDFLDGKFLFDTYEDYYRGPMGYGYKHDMLVNYPVIKSVCQKMRQAFDNQDTIKNNLKTKQEIKKSLLEYLEKKQK